MEPKHLQLKVNAILLENTVARGKDCIQQIRRRYVKVEVDEEEREVVRIRGNVHKKTMQGRADDFKPLDVVVHGQAEVLQKCALSILIFVLFQVEIIKKLVKHLPPVGCKYCVNAVPPKPVAVHDRCVCDDIFLQPLQHWRPSNQTWFARERRGNHWHQDVMKAISEEAKLGKIYTNGSIRPTVVTELLSAGLSNRHVMEFTGHKSHAMVQKYNRQLEWMNNAEVRQAKMLMNSSGRNALRGGENKFGDVDPTDGTSQKIGRNHKLAVQDGAGLGSIAKVNLELHYVLKARSYWFDSESYH